MDGPCGRNLRTESTDGMYGPWTESTDWMYGLTYARTYMLFSDSKRGLGFERGLLGAPPSFRYSYVCTALVDSPWSIRTWSIRTGSHLIDAGVLLGPHRSND